MVLLGGATFAFSVIGYPSKYLWRWYASAFGPEPQWAETANAAAETPDALETGEAAAKMDRSEERRVGKECLRLCRSRWSPYH